MKEYLRRNNGKKRNRAFRAIRSSKPIFL